MASTNLTLERGVLWFEDGTEVSNVSVNSLKALPDLLAALKDAEKYIGALPKPSVKKDFSGLNHLEQTLKAVRAAISKATGCSYCGGNCPADEEHACDGYLGDVDGLDSEERCEHTGMTRDELESLCGTPAITNPALEALRYHVTGAIERGEGVAITEQRADAKITELIRDVKDGDCALSAIFDDGSTRKLFNFFIDELAFFDADLLGKTETEAHQLHSARIIAYIQS